MLLQKFLKKQQLSPMKGRTSDPNTSVNSVFNILEIDKLSSSTKNYRKIEHDIFAHLDMPYQVNEIRLTESETLHTIFLKANNPDDEDRCYYLTHGFGGSSLMFFPIIKMLLQTGCVVLWELRGMGFSAKLESYECETGEIQRFFAEPIGKMLNYYKHDKINLIGHSLGAYSLLSYILFYSRMCNNENNKNPQNLIANNIEQVVLLSPVGLTSKKRDYKSRITGFSSLLHYIGNHISWKFQLTYKSPFRKLCKCLKNKVFTDAVKGCGLDQVEQELMKDLLLQLIDLSDGSQNLFFKLFEPRVLPKFPIEPAFNRYPLNNRINMRVFFGNEEDWADREGARVLNVRFPENFHLEEDIKCTHNFPFFPKILKAILSPIIQKWTKASSSQKISFEEEPKKLTKEE